MHDAPATARPRAAAPRRRGFLRAVALLPLVFATSLGVLLGASPASANSASGIAANSWIVSDLAADVLSSGYSPVTEAESIKYGSATVGTTAAAGLATKPKPSGKLGLIVNTAAMLGGLVFMWPGGEDAPAVPVPPNTSAYGSPPGMAWMKVYKQDVAVNMGNGRIRTTIHVGPNGPTPEVNQITTSISRSSGKCRNADGTESSLAEIGYGLGWDWQTKGYPTQYASFFFECGATQTFVGTAHHFSQVGGPAPQLSGWWNPHAGVEAPTGDPALVPRYIDSTATCKTPDGMGGYTTSIITDRVGPFTFDPAAPSELPEVPDLECPAGSFLDSGTRELATEGSSETVPLQTPYQAPDWVGEQATRFPECLPVGNLNCQLKLFRKATANDPELDCHSMVSGSGNACRDWATDPNKADRYECRFGSNVVALKQCEPYRETFKTTTPTVTPTPEVETAPPVTGADPTPNDTPNLGDCVPSWSLELLNPWWLFKGAACAISWAFVPQTALAPRVDLIRTELATKAPFSWFGGFIGLPVAIPNNGCPDWRVKVGSLDSNVICNSSYTEAIRTARPVLLVFMGSLALWPLIRSTAYAAFPIIKPQPGVLR